MAIDNPSTWSMWTCLILSITLIITRLVMRRWRRQNFCAGDYWCLAAGLLILGRLVGNHYLIVYGSTRTISSDRRLELLEPEHEAEASRLILGSKIVLFTRSSLVCILWCLKLAVLDLLSKIIIKMPFERKLLWTFWTALGISFIAAFTTVFVGCYPFNLFWQIYPDPGSCVIGNIWLFTYEACNILTDMLLMAVPLSLILTLTLPAMQRLRVLSLFSIGVFLISISIVRIVIGRNSRKQRAHTIWASLEVLFAVIVAVTPIIYALIRNTNEKRSFAQSELSRYTSNQTCEEGTTAEDRYFAGLWAEMNKGIINPDDVSTKSILNETSYNSMRPTT